MQNRKVILLYSDIFKKLFEIDKDKLFSPVLVDKIKLSRKSEDKRSAIELGDSYYIESHFDSTSKFERIKLALEIYELEDELFIKYRDDNS